jgi:hypothetical protein
MRARASDTSAPLRGRRTGSRSSIRWTSSASSGASSMARRGAGSGRRSVPSSPKGSSPVRSWYRVTPRAWTSVRSSSGAPVRCSGAMKAGVPPWRRGSPKAWAIPKSSTFTWPSSQRKTLAGLRSRWTTPSWWAWASALAISPAIRTASPSGTWPRSRRSERRDAVGVGAAARRLGLGEEPLRARCNPVPGPDQLHRHRPVQLPVVRLEDHAEAALPDAAAQVKAPHLVARIGPRELEALLDRGGGEPGKQGGDLPGFHQAGAIWSGWRVAHMHPRSCRAGSLAGRHPGGSTVRPTGPLTGEREASPGRLPWRRAGSPPAGVRRLGQLPPS